MKTGPLCLLMVELRHNLKSMKKFLFSFLLSSLAFGAVAQDEGLRYYDYVYLDNIKSVKFNVRGLFTSLPIITLEGRAQLVMTFDDLDGDYKDYRYAVVHCNADWTPSNLFENDYVDGFPENDIDNYDFSFKTSSIYTNYNFAFPNDDIQLTKSGNYLLKVYEDEDERRLAITRRFMVVDNRVTIVPDVVRPADVSKTKTHQEIDFFITHEGFEIRNPRTELAVTVLQNGRWDNAITGLVPLFSRPEEQSFDYQDKIVFPAGKEFRPADLRSIQFGTPDIEEAYFDENTQTYQVTLRGDKKRGPLVYREFPDVNGQFIIDNLDENNPDLMSHYVEVLFSLYSPGEMYDEDIYIFGGLTDWQLKPEFRMTYNPAVSAYVAKVKLKQGYYDYYYAALPKGSDQIDLEVTEGDWYETRNNYTILVYYRPFGGRYDQLIGSVSFNSRL